MPIRINVADRVKFKVAGSITNEAGARDAFEFSLIARRLDAEALRQRLAPGSGELVSDFLADIVSGWSGVRDDAGAEIPFGDDALRQLLRIPGLANIAMQAYTEEALARGKN